MEMGGVGLIFPWAELWGKRLFLKSPATPTQPIFFCYEIRILSTSKFLEKNPLDY